MSQNSEITTLNRILAELGFYENPNILKKEAQEGIDFRNVDKKEINKYRVVLTNIKWAQEKVLKYPLYFEEFYADPDSVPKHEALEHHVHAYIEDLNILRNKIHVFLGVLKNDLKKAATNKDEVNAALKFLEAQIYDVFKNVSDTRNPHNHKGNIFKDGDIVDVEFARMSLDKNFPLRSRFKPEFIEELKKQEVDSFDKAKAKWIERAQKNNEQTSGLVEDVLSRNRDFLYQLLNIKPLDF